MVGNTTANALGQGGLFNPFPLHKKQTGPSSSNDFPVSEHQQKEQRITCKGGSPKHVLSVWSVFEVFVILVENSHHEQFWAGIWVY